MAKAEIAVELAQVGATDEAARLISQVRETMKGLPTDLANSRFLLRHLAWAYASIGRYEEGLALVEEREPATRFEARCWIAWALLGAGKSDTALRVMKAARRDMAELDVRGHFARSIAQVYARAGYYRRALEIATELKEDSYRTDALNAITGQWLNPGARKPPEDVTPDLVRAAMDIESPELKSRALRYIAEAFAKAGEVEKALWLCDRISDSEYRVKATICVTESLIEKGETERALNLLSELHETARKRNLNLPPKIAGLYARAGRYEKALKLARTAPESSWWLSNALAWVARVRAEARDMEEGIKILSEAVKMAIEGPDRSEDSSFDLPDEDERSSNLNTVAVTWASALLKNPNSRILKKALKLTARMEKRKHQIDTLKKLADICGQTELALDQESCELLDDICSAKPGGQKNEETGSRQK